MRAGPSNGQGDLVVFFGGDSDFNLDRLLLAGNYTFHVYREPGAGAAQNLELEIDTSNVGSSRPDVAVGLSPANLRGVGISLPSRQSVSATSLRARAVTVRASVANRGNLPDPIAVSGRRGNAFFEVAYRRPADNITAGLISGAHRTAEPAYALDGDDDEERKEACFALELQGQMHGQDAHAPARRSFLFSPRRSLLGCRS